jgi:hypothetical protein
MCVYAVGQIDSALWLIRVEQKKVSELENTTKNAVRVLVFGSKFSAPQFLKREDSRLVSFLIEG